MGIAFQDGAVHERAGVALVRVAADILLIRVILLAELPLEAGGEAGAAAAPQARIKKGLDYIVRSHLGENFSEGLISAGSDILFNIFRIDDAAVAQGNPVLLFIKVRIA